MPTLTLMNVLAGFIFGLVVGAGWCVGAWLVGKVLR
jgi:hypothetical protein